jgi:hypothetical protein
VTLTPALLQKIEIIYAHALGYARKNHEQVTEKDREIVG